MSAEVARVWDGLGREPVVDARGGANLMYADVMPNLEDLACTTAGMADALSSARLSAMRLAAGGAVLIVGERGTGKETVGRYVHHHSVRAGGPFVPVDCTLLDPATAVTELLGRCRGETARRDSLGLVRSADGGTLYLDEVAALDLKAQACLARLLRTGVVERVGDGQPFPVDVRLIASTSIDVEQWLARGLLLPDLYRAWAGHTVRVPALRDRPADVPALAQCLLKARAHAIGEGAKSLTPPAAVALQNYRWPGNLPELAQSLHSAAARVRGRQIDVVDLPGQVRLARGSAIPAAAPSRVFVN